MDLHTLAAEIFIRVMTEKAAKRMASPSEAANIAQTSFALAREFLSVAAKQPR